MSTTSSSVKRKLLSHETKESFIRTLKGGGDREYNNILTQLQNSPSLIYARDSEGNTPLHIAADRRDIKVAELLIQHGAEVNLPNKFGETPLHCAFSPMLYPQIPNKEIISLLLDNGADCNQVNMSGNKPGYHRPETVEEVQNERKAKVIEESWEMENSDFSNYFQWFPRETKDEQKELLTSTVNSARKPTR